MNRVNHITKTACAVAAGLLGLACLPSAHSQTLIYTDTFPGAGTLDNESTSGISGVDGGSSGALPKSDGAELNTDGSGDLTFPATSSNHTAYARFDTIGNTNTYYDWAASPGAADITAAGGLTVSFNWIPNNTTDSSDWLYFVIGTSTADNSTSGGPMFEAATSNGILLKNSGAAAVLDSGSNEETGTFTPTLDNSVVLTYDFTSYAMGSPVTLTADVNGVQVLTDSFDWTANTNYMDIGSYQDSNEINSLQVNTLAAAVPEPGTYGMATCGLGALLLWGRMRRRDTKRLAV